MITNVVCVFNPLLTLTLLLPALLQMLLLELVIKNSPPALSPDPTLYYIYKPFHKKKSLGKAVAVSDREVEGGIE